MGEDIDLLTGIVHAILYRSFFPFSAFVMYTKPVSASSVSTYISTCFAFSAKMTLPPIFSHRSAPSSLLCYFPTGALSGFLIAIFTTLPGVRSSKAVGFRSRFHDTTITRVFLQSPFLSCFQSGFSQRGGSCRSEKPKQTYQ
jgi:hypothetical protein